jgi:hypothetical protein
LWRSRATAARGDREGIATVDFAPHSFEAMGEQFVDQFILCEFRLTVTAKEEHRIAQLISESVIHLERAPVSRWLRRPHC